MAAAAAEALPPPGVAVGAAKLLDEGFDSGPQAADGYLSAHDRGEAVLQDQRRIEILDLQEPLGSLFQSFLGDQSDNFARQRDYPVAGRFAFYHLKDAVDGRLFEVGKVHRDLGQTAHQEACTLHKAHAAVREAHCLGDLLGDVDVGRVEEDVISDEKFARAHHRGACRGMHAGLAKVRTARGVGRDLGADAFELAAADILQPLSFRSPRCGFVEIHGNLEALPYLFANVVRHGHAIFDSDAVDGDERNYIGCPHAGMRAGMSVQVDEFRGLTDAADGGFLNRFALADQSNHAAIVVGVHLAVQQVDAGHFHGVEDGVNFGLIAAFGEIGNTFDERGHNGEE